MRVIPKFFVASVLGLCVTGCQHLTPLVTEDTDRTGWIEIASVPSISVDKMQRVMIREGIPAWFDVSGYPHISVTVPPEHRMRATQIFSERGYHVISN